VAVQKKKEEPDSEPDNKKPDDTEDTETDKPQTDKPDNKKPDNKKPDNKNKNKKKECTVPEDLKSLLDDSVELENCNAGKKIKHDETCSFKCKSKDYEKNEGEVICRDGKLSSTAKCTKPIFSAQLLNDKQHFKKRLNDIKKVAKVAMNKQNDWTNPDAKNANCTNEKKKLYDANCWVAGTRCKKIIKEFQNEAICSAPEGFPRFEVGNVINAEDDLKSGSCTKMINDLKQIKGNINHGVGIMTTLGAHHDSKMKLIKEVNKELEDTIQELDKLSDSMAFLPQSQDDYPVLNVWLAGIKQGATPAERGAIENFSHPNWRERSNLQPNNPPHNNVFNPYRVDDKKSSLLSKNCAPQVEQLRGAFNDLRMHVFREVEEDAPQKPSHIVLSA